jgi:hypothetical protein
MPSLRIRISMDPDEYLPYYTGAVRWVVATAEDGRRVRFPASALQAHLRQDGVHGRFELRFDRHNRFVELRRLPGRWG